VLWGLDKTFRELAIGYSTGLAATTALIFVVKDLHDQIDRRWRAPATSAVLHHCTVVFNSFRYPWINMANSLEIEHDGEWYDNRLFDEIERKLDLQACAESHASISESLSSCAGVRS
jgi:hypothetical protein